MGAFGTCLISVEPPLGLRLTEIHHQRTLRKLVPNIPFQALVRGANGVGYTSYP